MIIGAYGIGPLTYAGWLVRRFGYRWTFIAGLWYVLSRRAFDHNILTNEVSMELARS